MTLRPAHDTDPEYAYRSRHQVQSPDRFEDWRSYAFSETPELVDDLDDATPLTGMPTV